MQILLLIFDIMGTLSFAVSGTLVGIKRKMDIFGVTVLAIVTATGGGILRTSASSGIFKSLLRGTFCRSGIGMLFSYVFSPSFAG